MLKLALLGISSTGGPLETQPIRAQKKFFQPIREPHMAHVTIWPRGQFSETGTECNALRAGLEGVNERGRAWDRGWERK